MKPRISVTIDQIDLSLGAILEEADIAAKTGVDGLWVSQLPNQRDAAMLLAGIAARTPEVTIGTGVTPIYQSPPVVMAQTAMTLDEICGNRFVLGIGRGHRLVGDWMIGGKYAATSVPMREYLTILTSLIREGEVATTGSWFSGRGLYSAPRRSRLPVYVGAFGPRMLELAGELADGVILWLCSPTYIRDVAMPALRAGWARRDGDHTGFEVVAMMPAVASDRPTVDRECARDVLNGYLRVENYQKLLRATGFADEVKALRASDSMIEELCAVGSREVIQERIAAFCEAGVTEIAVSPSAEKYFAATLEAAVG
ncbi:MAG TPA: LLM class flavin-dependent oxidoreductase [Streptosporangiaceae bacterium]|jgi:alkanesulfonate monooxygenase SsuD/methylene tetrahydromethanopterin reductase-like flavin-dependent oxidoreductase (luciferase family)